MNRIVWLLSIVLVLGFAAACGGGGNGTSDGEQSTSAGKGNLRPIPANSELVVGTNRFGMGLLDAENNPILGAPGTSLRLRFLYPAGDNAELKQEVDARFVWAIPDVTGFWIANVVFDEAGTWQVEAVLTRDGEAQQVTFTFSVQEQGIVPNIGDPAPPSENLTVRDDPDLSSVTTDDEPEPAFYQMTVAEALQAGKPFLVVFATPKFCQTRFCGPVVDNVKAVYAEFKDQINVVHIEPFALTEDGQLVTDADGFPQPSAPTQEWRLQSEPWVFVVGADGRIAARFEGTVSEDELREVLTTVLGQAG
jgi:hypothetical protein